MWAVDHLGSRLLGDNLRSELEPLQLSRLAERLRSSTAHGRTHISYTFDSQTSYISTTS
jgi:hypothetical protein